jgi:hypothetical protein
LGSADSMNDYMSVSGDDGGEEAVGSNAEDGDQEQEDEASS